MHAVKNRPWTIGHFGHIAHDCNNKRLTTAVCCSSHVSVFGGHEMTIEPGMKFGWWEIMRRGDKKLAGGTFTRPTYQYFWVCRCQCGNEKEVSANSLMRGNSKSCGCKRRMTYAERYEKEFQHLRERDEQFNTTKSPQPGE